MEITETGESSYLSPDPCKYTASLTINTPHQSGAFATTDEPTLTHHFTQSP